MIVLSACWSVCMPSSDEGNMNRITELTHEEQEPDTVVDGNAIQTSNQGLKMLAVLTANSRETSQISEPSIMSKQLGALEEKLAAAMRTLEEINKRLEASEMKLCALNSTVTERSPMDQGNNKQ